MKQCEGDGKTVLGGIIMIVDAGMYECRSEYL